MNETLHDWYQQVLRARKSAARREPYDVQRGYQVALDTSETALNPEGALILLASRLWNDADAREFEARPLMAQAYLQALRWLREAHA